MCGVRILVLVGSLRAESINRQIAELVSANSPPGVVTQIHNGLGELPFYNQDIDEPATPPAAVLRLRAAAAGADAALVVTPEYNGTIPAVLKNAIDWLSRPYGDGTLKGKPLAVIGAAGGRYGGMWAHDETRKSFGIAGGRVTEDVRLSIPLKTLDGRHPREHGELIAKLRRIVTDLATAVAAGG